MKTGRTLDFAAYLDVVHGMWVGKFIGGTLGAPIEGVKQVHAFTRDLVPSGIAENDDTDLQLLWLHALEEHGPGLTAAHLVSEWREHVRAPWNEYGIAAANWERGLSPPESGRSNNWFWGECMGCPIRSEIWGMICPGAPALAARYAGMDASLDHHGDAVEAEKFLAAIEASVFFEQDLQLLLKLGLAHVDANSRFASLVRDVIAWAASPVGWQDLRTRVLSKYGHPDMTHVLQNVGFTLIGLLRGDGDLGQTLAITLNCGYDADCSAATAGAILGGILGYGKIPERLRASVPEEYRVSDWMLGFPREGKIRALAESCCALGQAIAKNQDTGIELIGGSGALPGRLPVTPVVLPAVRTALRPYPIWRIVGPFWRSWEERQQSIAGSGEHGLPGLPSVHYFTHDQSGFDRDYLHPQQLSFAVSLPGELAGRAANVRPATSDVIPLAGLSGRDGPVTFYVAAEFSAPLATAAWLMLGSTGPVECWLNGQSVGRFESYQPLTPTTFPLKVEVKAGRNQVVLKLARTSQPLGAYLAFKRFTGAHWHQSFYETAYDWFCPLED